MRALFAGIGALLLAGSIASSSHQSDTRQEILRSHYRLLGQDGPLGYTELTELRRADGSRSYLARERME